MAAPSSAANLSSYPAKHFQIAINFENERQVLGDVTQLLIQLVPYQKQSVELASFLTKTRKVETLQGERRVTASESDSEI